MPRPREGLLIAAFAAMAVLVGGNAVGIRFSNRELHPLWGAGLRFALAATVLVAGMAVLRLGLPRGRALTGALLFGVLDVGGAFAFGYYALVELHAGFGSILLALVPLATLLLAVLQGQERLRVMAVAGTLVALVGVALMSRAPLQASLPLPSLLAALGSALCIAQAPVLVRRFPPVHPVTMNAVAMTAGAAVLIAGSVLTGRVAGGSPARGDVGRARLPRCRRLGRGVRAVSLRAPALGGVAHRVRLRARPVRHRRALRVARRRAGGCGTGARRSPGSHGRLRRRPPSGANPTDAPGAHRGSGFSQSWDRSGAAWGS